MERNPERLETPSPSELKPKKGRTETVRALGREAIKNTKRGK